MSMQSFVWKFFMCYIYTFIHSLTVGRWYVQLAAMWQGYLPLCVHIKTSFFLVFLSIYLN